jgi:putative ABC transport system permease protein
VTLSPRWKKIAGDIGQSQGRLVMMVVAIAAGVFAVAAISTAYVVLSRELDRSYRATNPASALLDVDPLDAAAVALAKQQPGIAWAEAGGRLLGRVEVRANEWLPLLLFVVPDFGSQRIGLVRLEAGHWPSDAGIVLERTAVSVANTAMDRAITVQTQSGVSRSLTVTGVVHDPSLAPAWQEQIVYGYVASATLHLLGEDSDLHILKLRVNEPAGDPINVEHTIAGVAGGLQRTGHAVGEIRIPPPHHPHQAQMTSVTGMLLVFSLLTLVLAAVLTATLTASLLAPQVRQIGVMKAMGARSGQIMGLYAGLIAAIGALAVCLGLPLGIAGGRALALNVAHLLNLSIATLEVPCWLYIGQALAGVALPLLAALLPIVRATRRTVHESLNDYGASPPASSLGYLARWTSLVTPRDPALALAVRNSVRRKARLVLTLGLLATAGALFMTSLNIKAAWQRNLMDAGTERHFDTEIQFVRPVPAAAVIAVLSAVPGVRRVEPFSDNPAALARPDGLNIVRTFPDGGHGSLRVESLPWGSAFVKPNVMQGHWLGPDDVDGAIVNLQALPFFPGLTVGDSIHLMVLGRAMSLRVEGLVREHLTGATVYMSSEAYARAMVEPGLTTGIRIGLQLGDAESAARTTAAIERSLQHSGFKVARSTSQAQLGRALAGHLFILIFVLILMSVLMALVGCLGLASAMATGVLERIREFAVMRAIGARNPAILRTVIGEGVFVGTLSVAAAALLSAPLTIAVARVVGVASLGPALGVVSAAAISPWLAIVLVGAAAASAYPAWTASKLTIREALAYQ